MEEYKCKLCLKEFKNYECLKRHMSRKHKVNSIDFYVEFILKGNWPTCGCGCGGKVKWSYTDKRFREFCAIGHLNRVRNNWGHNKKAIDNSAETRRKQYENGERQPWCKGLSSKTDIRLKEYGKKISNKFTEERKKEYSIRMKNNRLNGITPTLFGPESSQWKGGISEVNNIARSDKRLYDEWKYPILIRDEFKCVECGSSEGLHIHHNKETMSEIVKKHVIDDTSMEFEIKKLIAEKVVEYHIKNKVSGITLCKKCHNNLHPSLNFNH